MINRGDDLTFDGTLFIGRSDFMESWCLSEEKVGISLHPARLQETILGSNGQTGAHLINTEFRN
jgi:hypothetical protein